MLSCQLAYGLWCASHYGRYRTFRRSLERPEATQARILRDILKRNQHSAWGRRHRFGALRSVEAFQENAPLTTFDDYLDWIDRIQAGEEKVLTTEPVRRLVPSSGSTKACKLIPFTASGSEEFARAVGPWIVDMLRRDPSLRGGPAYWSVTPSGEFQPPARSGPPVGFAEDAEYLGGISTLLVNLTLATPRKLLAIPAGPRFRYLTLLYWLRTPELRLVSVWNPSFLTLLLEDLEDHWDALLRDVERGFTPTSTKEAALGSLRTAMPNRARDLARLSAARPDRLWPRLGAVSSWTDGPAALALRGLESRWPGLPSVPKGLLATEAVVSLPFQGHRPVAINSHFYEFLDPGGTPHLAHQLVDGEEYSVVVTTGAGLYRYRLHDRVRVEGFLKATPCVRFLGKEDHISDLFGEKLNANFVSEVVETLLNHFALKPTFALLAPHEDHHRKMGYQLFLDQEGPLPSELESALENKLQLNPHYKHCVQLGQLQPARVLRVEPGAQSRFLEFESHSGKALGDIKPSYLSGELGWSLRLCPRANLSSPPKKGPVF